MSVEANAMADTDPIDGSFKADLGGLAKITYFKNGNHFSAKLGYRRESFQAALAYDKTVSQIPPQHRGGSWTNESDAFALLRSG